MRDDDYYFQRYNWLINRLNVQVYKTFYYSISMIVCGFGLGFLSATPPGGNLTIPASAMLLAAILWYLGFRVKDPPPFEYKEKTPK